jgi:hypothetical protein
LFTDVIATLAMLVRNDMPLPAIHR